MREGTRIRDRIRNRLSVREQTPMRGREMVSFLTLSVLIALPAGFGLWQQNGFVRTRFSIEALRKEKLALQERYRCLRIEQGTLESLSRIAEEAKRGGLVPREETGPPIVILPGGRASPPDLARGASGGPEQQGTLAAQEHRPALVPLSSAGVPAVAGRTEDPS